MAFLIPFQSCESLVPVTDNPDKKRRLMKIFYCEKDGLNFFQTPFIVSALPISLHFQLRGQIFKKRPP